MRYELLGPLRVIGDEGDIATISAQKIETLLAVLVIRLDQVVATDQLMTEIWGEWAPLRATAGIHVYVSQLRKFLARCGGGGGGDARRAKGAGGPVVTRRPGYLLRGQDSEVDYLSFLELVDLGRDHMRAGRHERASVSLQSALDLWRGSMMSDRSHGPIIEGFATWLSETRLECTEMLIDAQLELGRHRELVGRLYTLTAEHPLREAFARQLMLSLYRSERKADALEVYRSVRQTINDELGLEPCRALQDLQQGILTGAYDLEWAV